MKYTLTTSIGLEINLIDLDQSTFMEIRAARDNLFEALYIEQKFDLLIYNYLEYEQDLLSIASQHMIQNIYGATNSIRDLNNINRRIANLLSSCRMYLDQSIHHLNNIYGKNNSISKKVNSLKSEFYDNSFEYRMMDAMRNYVQHRGFAIHKMYDEKKKVDNGGQEEWQHVLTPFLRIPSIDEGQKLKKVILKEVEESQIQNELWDIKPIIRKYIDKICKINNEIRQLTREDIDAWDKLFVKYFGTVSKNLNFSLYNQPYSIQFSEKTDDDQIINLFYISMEVINTRKYLRNINSRVFDLDRSFVSNQIFTDTQP